MGGAIPQAVNTNIPGGILMLNHEYITVRQLLLSDLPKPEHASVLIEFAGTLAPPCVAEALMRQVGSSKAIPKIERHAEPFKS